eukprot:TRINITY_DN2935_c0_g2_i2.p1 TRINITY_DN2935_c0_g2~~TRINITY_DN2935_c0_g2_i2.p1  ORF type:complete len:244 (-),score=31.10 TRINITY_DN2935_c0_g2_i2:65-796(-)
MIWIVALRLTTTVRASLFTSTYPLIMVFWMRLRGIKVSAGETVGVLCSLAGLGVCMLDGIDGSSTDGETSLSFLGDAMCFLSAFFFTFNIAFGSTVRQTVPLFTYNFIVSMVLMLEAGAFSLIVESDTSFGTGRRGVFGWTDHDMIVVAFLVMGLFVSALGLTAFNFGVKYMNPVIFSTIQLADPAITGWISWTAGLEGLPGKYTMIGGLIVTVGILFVIIFEHRRKVAMESLQNEKASQGQE